MARILTTLTIATAFALGAVASSHQGGQGRNMREMDGSVQAIDRTISTYLSGEEIKTILSPGEFCEWTLNLKAGQVVIAEARSDAFDPALEIVDEKNKSLATNDDRYPGDQRPLLLWRCSRDGAYSLHLRCFHDKSGGQAFVRFKTYDSVDVGSDQKSDKEVGARAAFLLRIPMKAGEIKEVISNSGGNRRFQRIRGRVVIAPNGLPDINLSLPIQAATDKSLIMAPVAGDYYFMVVPLGSVADRQPVQVWTRDLVARQLSKSGDTLTGKAATGDVALWELPVKKGDLLETSTPELDPACMFLLAEAPDVSKYNITKADSNPFYPQATRGSNDNSPFVRLTARSRDNRKSVFFVQRDAKLWLASNGAGPSDRSFTLNVKPAAASFTEETPNSGNLRIGNTDYWGFEAKAGDVMTLNTKASGFSGVDVVYGPDFEELRHVENGVDQATDNWRMIVQKPGRYVVAVSCLGDGGGGEYSLTRKAIHAKEFGLSNPAKDEIAKGQVQIWKFTATPDMPLLVHWNSSNWHYDINVYDDKGRPADFQHDEIDANNRFGILKVGRPQTYVIVLTGTGDKASYSIELGSIPGFKKPLK